MKKFLKYDKEHSNKVLDVVKKYANIVINSHLYVILIGLILTAKMILFYYNTIYQKIPMNRDIIPYTFIFSMFIVSFLFLLKNKSRFIVSTIVNFLFSCLMFADEVYYSYSSGIISIAQFGNLKYSEQIAATIGDLVKFTQIFYFIDIVFVLFLISIKFIRLKKDERYQWKPIVVFFIIMAIIYSTTIKIYMDSAKEYKYNKNMQIEVSTLYGSHLLDVYSVLNMKKLSKYKNYDDMMVVYNNLNNEYQEKYKNDLYNMYGVAKNYNVIVIQLESLQDYVINKSINGKEITPNINKFLNENIRFNNFISQSYTTTADSEHSVINSLYPLENGMAFSQYCNNDYDDIFGLMKKADYETMYVHGNNGSFWNRNNVYKRLSVDNMFFMDSFSSDSELINNWISDEAMYNQTFEKVMKLQSPFFANIISASSHTCFDLPGLVDKYNKVSIDVGKYKDTYFGNYLEAINYADYAFGLFIDNLKKEGFYDNTMIFIYGDHYGVQMYNEEMIEFINNQGINLNNVETEINYVKVAAGVHIPNVESKNIDKVVSKLDIKPTICYLMGIEDGFSLGTNMFENKDFVCLDNGIIVGNDYYYNGNWYVIKTGDMLNKDDVSFELKEYFEFCEKCMNEELSISNSVILNNLLKK